MNFANLTEPSHNPGEPSCAGSIARVEILDSLDVAEPVWRQLEQGNAVRTPYQTFDLLAAWQRNIGAAIGVMPFVVVGFDANDKAAFLWPLGHSRTGPVSVISFLGGKHANFNFGLWRRDIVTTVTAEDIRAILTKISATRFHADILSLLNQPYSWDGFANPFTLLPHQPSPSSGLRLTMSATGEEQTKRVLSPAMRSRLRTKERRLEKLPGYHYLRATTPSDVNRLLAEFFPLKAAHMKAQALPDIFCNPHTEAFLREACYLGLASGKPLVEIHAIECDGELLALLAAINDGNRSSGMFNTYTMSDNARQSPGLVLLVHIIADLADRGVKSFDLGVGEASYKTFFCNEQEPLFDNFVPLTPLGKLASVTARASGRVKRQIKQSHVLWSMVRVLRQASHHARA